LNSYLGLIARIGSKAHNYVLLESFMHINIDIDDRIIEIIMIPIDDID